MNKKITTLQSLICSAGILILSACTNLDPLRKESTESSKYDGPSFIVSNPDKNLDERYQDCLVKAEKNTQPLEGASKGVGGTVLVSPEQRQ